MNYGIIFWGNSRYSNKVFKLQKRIAIIFAGSMSRDSSHYLLKILIFLLFHLNIYFPSYILLLQTMINTCLTQRYMEEILDSYRFSSTNI